MGKKRRGSRKSDQGPSSQEGEQSGPTPGQQPQIHGGSGQETQQPAALSRAQPPAPVALPQAQPPAPVALPPAQPPAPAALSRAQPPAPVVVAPQPTVAEAKSVGKKKHKGQSAQQLVEAMAATSIQPKAPPKESPRPSPTKSQSAKNVKDQGQVRETIKPATPTPAQLAAPAVKSPQLTPVKAKPAGKKGKSPGQQPQQPAASAAPQPSTSAAMGDVVKKTEQITSKTYKLPKRKTPIKHVEFVKETFIQVNYLTLTMTNKKLRIFHYDVSFEVSVDTDELAKSKKADEKKAADKQKVSHEPRKADKKQVPKYFYRLALEEMRKRNFQDRHPAFDGRANMYVAGTKLNLKSKKDELTDTVTVQNKESGKERNFEVTIKLVNEDLNISRLFEYCSNGSSSSIPTEIQATDVALRSGLTPRFTPAGRSFFAKPKKPETLGDGLELWHGFYQSAVMAWNPYLNVDVANKAFPIEQTVLEFLESTMSIMKETLKNDGLKKTEHEKLRKFIKGLKVEYDMPSINGGSQKRTYKVDGLGRTAFEEKFKLNGDESEISVGMYYSQEKKYEIKFPKLPLLRIGTNGSVVPLELCKIIGNQAVMRKLDEKQTSKMVSEAAKSTIKRKERIDENIGLAEYGDNPTLREFGIKVETPFKEVKAVQLKSPKIEYKNNAVVDVRDGVWRMDQNNFITAQDMPTWAVLNLNQNSQRFVMDLERMMQTTGRNVGMNVPPPQSSVVESADKITEKDIVKHLTNFKKNGVRLVFVVLSGADNIYGMVKRASELQVGVLTQCLRFRTLKSLTPMTATNILLKVNSKLRGVNHHIDPSMMPRIMQNFMLIGADVTHPAPGSVAENTPSIAAVAASHDPFGFKYKMMYRLQPSREEMIIDLADIMKALLKYYYRINNNYPEKLLYFRDGVSEGQFQKVLEIELEGIQKACLGLQLKLGQKYEPHITFVVVQKRHHTRFFPKAGFGDAKNRNVPPGTLVDSEITHPTEVDFYLVSHKSIQGTARPTKYHLLHDDSNIPVPELEKLTYYLCHMFSRCTRAVSYPAPTYYAHLAAFRARAWWDRTNVNMKALKTEQDEKGRINENIMENHPMFFV